jgi:hypothetical protein
MAHPVHDDNSAGRSRRGSRNTGLVSVSVAKSSRGNAHLIACEAVENEVLRALEPQGTVPRMGGGGEIS